MDRVRGKVKTGRMCNNDTDLSARGIPPRIVLANRMAEIEVEIEKIRGEMTASFNELPVKYRDAIVDNMTIEGVVPVAPSQISGIVEKLRDELLTGIHNSHSQLSIRSSSQCIIHDSK